MTKITKGVPVYLFANYNSKGTFTFRKCVVKSCGAKRMTLESMENGKMINTFVLAHQYGDVVAVADVADPVEYARNLAAEYCADRIEFNTVHRLGNLVYIQSAIIETIETLTNATPRGISWEDACRDFEVEYAARLKARGIN
ncbi:hypothetical protein [Janthinobacterium sp.]|uniref:hypothetical protein n=1 Tax=Janthinobacterium sp. TaxID=1871054 RepID=UPI002604129D|nr:hypothetical protein [Janthinobacterium sp.]